jgi:hypothetical protein
MGVLPSIQPSVLVLFAGCEPTILEDRDMGGLVAFLFIGYLLHRTRVA